MNIERNIEKTTRENIYSHFIQYTCCRFFCEANSIRITFLLDANLFCKFDCNEFRLCSKFAFMYFRFCVLLSLHVKKIYRDFNLMNWISNIRKHWQLHTKKRDGNQNRYGMTPNWHSYFLSLKSSNRNEYQLPTWTMTNSPICFFFFQMFFFICFTPCLSSMPQHLMLCVRVCFLVIRIFWGSTITIWW